MSLSLDEAVCNPSFMGNMFPLDKNMIDPCTINSTEERHVYITLYHTINDAEI